MLRWIDVILIAGLSSAAPTAQAHDFWLQLERYQLATPGPVRLEVRVGHGRDVERWEWRWERVVALRSAGPEGLVDQQRHVVIAGSHGAARPQLGVAGTHVLAFESHHALSTLPAERFDAYAREEGLTLIQAVRAARPDAAGRPGTELYSRRAKAIVQVGPERTADALRPVGHTLEIVPAVHPYGLSADRRLPVTVLFRGRPLTGARVDLSGIGANAESAQAIVTGPGGQAVLTVPAGAGPWMLNVVWSVPIDREAGADYETVFSSLTFEASEGR